MSMTSSLSSRNRNKYGGIWRRSNQLFQGMLSHCYLKPIYRRVLLFVCSMNRKTIYSVIYISVTRGRRWRQRHRKTRFSFGSCLVLTQLLQLGLNLKARLLLFTAASSDELQANESIQWKMTAPHFMPKPLITVITATETIFQSPFQVLSHHPENKVNHVVQIFICTGYEKEKQRLFKHKGRWYTVVYSTTYHQ